MTGHFLTQEVILPYFVLCWPDISRKATTRLCAEQLSRLRARLQCDDALTSVLQRTRTAALQQTRTHACLVCSFPLDAAYHGSVEHVPSHLYSPRVHAVQLVWCQQEVYKLQASLRTTATTQNHNAHQQQHHHSTNSKRKSAYVCKYMCSACAHHCMIISPHHMVIAVPHIM